jgi:Holliday junction resolvase
VKKPIVTERESDIQAGIRDFLRWKGWMVWKNHQSLGSYRGLADLTAVKDGVVLFIEVKTSKGRLSEYQQRFRDELVQAGGNYLVARNVEQVEQALRDMPSAG